MLFRHHVVREEPWRRIFLPIFLGLAPFCSLIGTEGMKRVFLSYLWKMPPETLAKYSRDFAASVMPAIYPEVLEEVERHRQEGHLLIMVSASPEFYVAEIGKKLGFHLIHGTVLENRLLFPDLVNHKGAAKVERLHEVLPPSYFERGMLRNCRGYTDSTADLPMLELCQSALLVNPSPKLVAAGKGKDWKVVRPSRPWKSKLGFAWRAFRLLFGIGHDPGGLGS